MKHLKKFNESLEKDSEENLNSKLFYELPTSFTIDDLRKAFNAGQKSIEIKMKQKESYDEYGDMVVTLLADKEVNKKFEDWLSETWD